MNAVGAIVHVDLVGHACVDVVQMLVLDSSQLLVGYFGPCEGVGRYEACPVLSGESTSSVFSWHLR